MNPVLSNELQVISECVCNASAAYFALSRGGGHFPHVLLVFGVGGVLCQFIKHVCAWRVCDVQIMSQSRAIGSRAGEWMLLIGLL